MTNPTSKCIRLLVVEDQKDPLEVVLNCLKAIRTWGRYKMTYSKPDTATSASAAAVLLEQAKQSKPYDLVLLDLVLPKNKPGDGTEDIRHGIDLLELIKGSQMARAVVVISAYNEYDTVVKSFRGGALDFIAKPYFQHDFEPIVLNV